MLWFRTERHIRHNSDESGNGNVIMQLQLALLLVAATEAPVAVTPGTPATIKTYPSFDYPRAALANGQQGTVEYVLAVRPNGKAGDCQVTKSSGYPLLDRTTCEVMTKKARFNPARGIDGRPIVGRYRSRMKWITPAPVILPAGG